MRVVLVRHLYPRVVTIGAGQPLDAAPRRDPAIGSAESALRAGRHDEALRHLAELPPDTPLPAALAWRLGVRLHQRGEFEAAESLYARASYDADTDPTVPTDPADPAIGADRVDPADRVDAADPADPADRADPAPGSRDRARVLAGWAAARWARGDRTRARLLADEAVRVAERSRDDAAVAAAYLAQALVAFSEGDRAANEHAYARALAAAERAGDVEQQLRIRSNIGSRLLEEGRFRAAVDQLTAAIRLGGPTGQPTLLALALHNRAEAWLGLGDLAAARADADESLTRWQRDGSPLAALGLLTTARVHQARGSARQAAAAYREAVAMAEPDDNTQVLVPAWAGLARTCHADDPVAARRYAHRALTVPSAAGPVVGELAAGWVALCDGDSGTAGRHADAVRAEAGRRRDPIGLAEALELAALAAYRTTTADSSGRTTTDAGSSGRTTAAGSSGRAATDAGSSGRVVTGTGRSAHGGTGRGVGRFAAGLIEAAAIWADAGNEVALAVNALLRARCGGDPLAEDVARDRLHRLGVREDAWQIAGPLAALGPPRSPRWRCRRWATSSYGWPGPRCRRRAGSPARRVSWSRCWPGSWAGRSAGTPSPSCCGRRRARRWRTAGCRC
ncbi:hypothetical protein GCM10027605_15840 [Micromonospora zhanjiangensis]